MLYFAYGSNMLKSRLEERLGQVHDLGIATLTGFKLPLDKESKDGTGKANIRAVDDGWVHGMVYDLEETQMKSLDKFEVGYIRLSVSAKMNDELTSIETYVAVKNRINENLKPAEDYMQYIISGAKEHLLPPSYIQMLEDIPVQKG